MRQGKVFYKDVLAGVVTETNEGEFVFPEDSEELALTLRGRKKKLRHEDFDGLGEELGLTTKQIGGSFKRMIKSKEKALNWLEESFLSENLKETYIALLESRYKQLGL